MTAKKINKIDIELSPKVKRVAMSTASILLGASLMGTAKPIKKIVGDKYDDEIGLVVKADTIEGTENSSDVVTTVDQEDQTSSETENTTSTNEVSNNQNLESSEDNASNNELSGKNATDSVQTTAASTETTNTKVEAINTSEQTTTSSTETTNTAAGVTAFTQTSDEKTEVEVNTSVQAPETTTEVKTNTSEKELEESTSTETVNEQVTPETQKNNTSSGQEKTTPTYQDSVDKVNQINDAAQKELQNAIDTLTKEVEALGGKLNITVGDKVDINTNVNGIETNKKELEKHIQAKLDKFDSALAEYKNALTKYDADLAEYKKKLAEYNKKKEEYIQKLKDMGLWNDGNVDLDEIKQDLILSDKEENTKVEAEILNNFDNQVGFMKGESILGFLDHFYQINGQIKDEFLKLTYTGFEKSYYGNELIGKIEITFSDWTPQLNTPNKYQGIYFGDKLTDGFFYTKSEGVTMGMKLYDSKGNLITLKSNTAYITVGSLNSTGKDTNYVEKAEIINGTNQGGNGVVIPGSSVSIHQGQYGDGITIRFSNKVGSAWATYSTTVPKLSFEGVHPGKEPEKPVLNVSYSPGNMNLAANGSVHIHYIDVHGVSGVVEYEPTHGIHLDDRLQSILHLGIGDEYTNLLWDWEKHGYVLATSPDKVHPGTQSGQIDKEGEQHYWIYLTHDTKTTTENVNRDKEVNQTIH
ncbi:GbpC/Spa domain-containing protein [Lactobacillus kefiranofaciens]|uniref:GbpC/Spa domain-containing protein n=1 Tax=Lactobacillus kefiranofaciens TaxID=267818 RepID=UPI001669632A|nr:hypothetical protein [Lactobacillus kefiranofaciens]MCJ2172231.1 hypothetical protein [Lactobacillus kefiranofaciens]QNT43869.1 hypothetical protein ICI50_08650 [Lactobacillus kefiranofaciens]